MPREVVRIGLRKRMTEQLRTVEAETKRSRCAPHTLYSVAYVQQTGGELTQVMGVLQKILGLIA